MAITKIEIQHRKKPVVYFKEGDGIFTEYRHELDRVEKIVIDPEGVRVSMWVLDDDGTMISVEIAPDMAEALRRISIMSDRIEKLEAMLAQAGAKL